MEYLIVWWFIGYAVGMVKANTLPNPTDTLLWAVLWAGLWPILWMVEASSGIDNP